VQVSLILLVFGVIFLAELPDKSMFASLALSTRFKRSHVWLGAASAFFVQVIIAVTAGRLVTLIPHKVVEGIIIGALFLSGAALLVFGARAKDEKEERSEVEMRAPGHSVRFLKGFTTSFIVIFLGEWGDITQIVTASYAARYHAPLSVGIGALAGLWAVSGLAVVMGSKLLGRVPRQTLNRIVAIILFIFAFVSLFDAFK